MINKPNSQKMTVQDVLQAISELAPPELAEPWDAVGLQAGDPGQPVSQALLVLDVTLPLIAEAAARGCSLIISHHPLIFTPLPAVRTDNPEQNLVYELAARRLSLISAHTNLDAAPGGVADCLADRLQLDPADRRNLGKYGRSAGLAEPVLLSRLMHQTRELLGSPGCRTNTDQDRLVRRLAVFPGSLSEDCLPELVADGADALVCGELKHHLGLMLAARGIAAIDAGHDVSERVVLQPLAARLSERLPQISFAVSGALDYNKMVF